MTESHKWNKKWVITGFMAELEDRRKRQSLGTREQEIRNWNKQKGLKDTGEQNNKMTEDRQRQKETNVNFTDRPRERKKELLGNKNVGYL